MKIALLAFLALLATPLIVTAGELPAYYLTMNSVADVNNPTIESRIPALDDNREVLVSAAAAVNTCNFATQFTFEDAAGHPVSVDSAKITTIDFGLISVIGGVTTHHLNHINMAASRFNPEGDGARPNIYMTDADGVTVSPAGQPCTTKVTASIRHINFTDHVVQLGVPTPFPKLANVGDQYNLYRTIQVEFSIGGHTYMTSLLDTASSVQVVGLIPAFPQSSTPTAGSIPVIETVETINQGEGGTSTKLTVSGLNETWPYNVTLEWSTDLVNWSEVTNGGGGKNLDGTWYLTIPVTGPRKFFRLSYPKRWNWLIGD